MEKKLRKLILAFSLSLILLLSSFNAYGSDEVWTPVIPTIQQVEADLTNRWNTVLKSVSYSSLNKFLMYVENLESSYKDIDKENNRAIIHGYVERANKKLAEYRAEVNKLSNEISHKIYMGELKGDRYYKVLNEDIYFKQVEVYKPFEPPQTPETPPINTTTTTTTTTIITHNGESSTSGGGSSVNNSNKTSTESTKTKDEIPASTSSTPDTELKEVKVEDKGEEDVVIDTEQTNYNDNSIANVQKDIKENTNETKSKTQFPKELVLGTIILAFLYLGICYLNKKAGKL